MAEPAVSGAGIGLRSPHHQEVLDNLPPIRWFEILTENYLGDGPPQTYLEQIRTRYPITLHGVGMSLGSVDPLNVDYLRRLKLMVERFEPEWVSDHIAWISIGGEYLHDLLPLPYTEEALEHVAGRIQQVQDFLGRRILVENPSTYLSFRDPDMTEWDFVRELAELADCYLLFDVNNVYVNASNHGYDVARYVEALPADRIKEIHLAGYEEREDYLFDTHSQRVHAPVWDLYRLAIQRFGPVPSLIEWDTDIPPLQVLVEEAAKAQSELEMHR